MATNSSVIPDLTTPGGQPREFRESHHFGIVCTRLQDDDVDVLRTLYGNTGEEDEIIQLKKVKLA